MKAVLVHFLWPDIGHVITRLTGRDGTAKTWATRILRSLIDPSAAPTRAVPRDETDWIVAVNAALIAAIDNVSAIPDWLSDAMCRASTGEGLMRRKLYTRPGCVDPVGAAGCDPQRHRRDDPPCGLRQADRRLPVGADHQDQERQRG